ncbi:MAG: hypothetical protein KGL37_09035, partial [Acidobacteriota bacterium]|nr:hypothetical protein [Acidobacteriota bacterium]
MAGFMPVGLLFPDGYTIPWYDTKTKKGYQRQPQDARINQLANDLRRDRTDLPTALLLNLRTREAKAVLKDGFLDLQSLISSKLKFHVVDGQH